MYKKNKVKENISYTAREGVVGLDVARSTRELRLQTAEGLGMICSESELKN